MTLKSPLIPALAASIALFAAGCEQETPVEETGEAVQQGAEETGEQAGQAAEQMQEGTQQ